MKRFITLALCASMLLSSLLTGCSDGTRDNTETPAQTTSAPTTGADEETTAEDAAPEADGEDTNDTDGGEEPGSSESVTDANTDASRPEEETTDGHTEEVTTEDEEDLPADGSEEAAWPRIRLIYASKPVESVAIRAGEDSAEQYAAQELCKYLEKMGITVREDGSFPITIRIDSALSDDSYQIQTGSSVGDGMTITGGNGRGVIYGVYGFLEKKAGVRFFTPELETCTSNGIQLSKNMLIEYTPVFESRHTDWFSVKTNADWFVKNGLNCSIYVDIGEEMGSKWSYGSQFVHNICAVTNTDPNAQPCLTDPEILAYAIQYVRNRLENEPNVNIITVSQMDNQNYCTCANCAAVDAEEGSPAGTLLRFVNAIANDIAEDYPDVVIDTLAYLYTRKAPQKTVPAPNVCIRLCPIECCFVHALDDPSCPANVAFCQDLVDWSKICDRIYIWDYTTNFCHYVPTFNNLKVMRENMQFFAEHNVKGMFSQGNGASVSGEFGELRAYLLAKLMMNPLMTEEEYDKHMNEFLKAYYGKGWEYIRSYIDLTTVLSESDCQDCMNHPRHSVVLDLYPLVEDNLNEWWDKAEELAGSRLAYVKRSRLQWRYIQLMLHPDKDVALVFIEDVKAAGVTWGDGTTSQVPERADLTLGPEYWFVQGYWLPEN